MLRSVGPPSPPMTKSWSTRVSFTQEVMLPPLPLAPDLPPLPPPLLPPLLLPPLADWPPLPPELVPALPPFEAPPGPPSPEPQATITETIPRADASEKGRSMTSMLTRHASVLTIRTRYAEVRATECRRHRHIEDVLYARATPKW